MHAYVPERWSLITINVTNPDEVPREILSSTYFEIEPTLQYARKIWIPARSKLRTWLPVRVPKMPEGPSRALHYRSLVTDAAEAREVFLKDDSGQNLPSGTLSATREKFVTAFIDEPDDVTRINRNAAYDLLTACRKDQNYSRRMTNLAEPMFAPDDLSLQPFNQLVICCNRPKGDPASLAAIRRWVYGGGRLWVMLNQVDAEVLETILGDSLACAVVDHVGLTTVKIDPVNEKFGKGTASVDYEEPIDFARVIVDDREAEVGFTVNGWPAAFTKSYGRGTVLVTMLAPRAMYEVMSNEERQARRKAFEQANPGIPADLEDVAYKVVPPMHYLAGKISGFEAMTNNQKTDSASGDLDQTLASFATEYIGHTIPSRNVIGGILASFGFLVALCGIWLWRRQTLEHLGWIGPGLGVATAAVLVVVGATNRHEKEYSVAAVQLIEALPGVDDANVTGGLAFYAPESSPWTIRTRDGGRLSPEMSGLDGTTRRLVWNDLADWSWEHLRQDTPQRTAQYRQSLSVPARWEARATFGPDGMTGHVSAGDVKRLSEVIVATRDGRIGVDIKPDGTFTASASRVFSSDQYVEAGLLGDEQDRRRRFFPAVIANTFGEDWSGPPLLMAWTTEPKVAFEFDAERRQLGASLLLIPIGIERPPVGSELRIPAPLLPFRDVNRLDGTPSSQVWSARRHEWQERKELSTVWLRFQIPPPLLPIEAIGGRLTVQVTGPVFGMELFGRKQAADGSMVGVSLERWDNPVGTRKFELTDCSLLQVTEDGGVFLGLTAGDPNRDLLKEAENDDYKTSSWQIVHLELELNGKIPAVAPAEPAGAPNQ
jgi:hypothetical protein